jgi:hypothetical protein
MYLSLRKLTLEPRTFRRDFERARLDFICNSPKPSSGVSEFGNDRVD